MAQNEMQDQAAASPAGRFWRLDLNQPTLWQATALVVFGFAVGALFGLIFS